MERRSVLKRLLAAGIAGASLPAIAANISRKDKSVPTPDSSSATNADIATMSDVAPVQLRNSLFGPDGAKFIGIGKTKIDQLLEVHVKQFGAHEWTEPGYENFDSAPAFREAIAYAAQNGIGSVNAEGKYKLLSAGPTMYTLPYDDGTVSPEFIKGGTDHNIDAEKRVTMPVVLDVPSYVRLKGGHITNTYWDFGWSRQRDPINIKQHIGIVFRVSGYPKKDRMVAYVKGIGISNVSISRAFIGIVSDGVMFYHTEFNNVNYNNCGIPLIAQGADSMKFGGTTSLENCLAGIVIGGMWLTRNNTWRGGKWVPPYVDGTDIYAMGWCDALKVENITASYGDSLFGARHLAIDKFFDTYFYKSANSRRTADGGRMTNVDAGGRNTDYSKEPYRGISHRAFINFSRYGRGNCNIEIKDSKIWGTSRIPFYGANLVGDDYYGHIDNIYAENVGFLDPTKPWSDENNFYKSGIDPYNRDRDDLLWVAAEGKFGVDKMTIQGTRWRETSQATRPFNGRQKLVIYARKMADLFTGGAPISMLKSLRLTAIYTDKEEWMDVERLAADRYEIPPIAFDRSDADSTHLFRHRIVPTQLKLHQNNQFVGEIKASAVYTAGKVELYCEMTIPADAASLTGDMNIRWIPIIEEKLNYGSSEMGIMVFNCNIISHQQCAVHDKNGKAIGNAFIPKLLIAASGTNQTLRLFSDHQKTMPLSIADFAPGSLLNFKVEYNSTWKLW
ncbi:hypothetical protein [Serratia marcescens]|uniref:hypothetical protein n=1 Tax=Serratia marcescens TaxID=615 RepID=UPI0023805EF2|nr:hypothetical protein [Serratia marcescens]MDF9718418.1 hypothetical protein [Serratia marcescens]